MINLNKLLEICIEEKASDLHLTVGKPPTLRVDGRLRPIDEIPLSKEETASLVKDITPQEHLKRIEEVGGDDFGFTFKENMARFRVSVYKQKGFYGLALRLIPSKLLSFEEIGLPDVVKDLMFRPRGLMLVCGPTGCGKTTTLASMTDFINVNRECHIITIEDPIEYFHEHKKSIITQREVGRDVSSFAEAIIRGLRSNPDVILVGEMRDLATMKAAIMAAETGHLVFATLHTNSASETIDRIINVFPPDEQEQIRIQLSTSLSSVLCQQLLVKSSGKGRVAAFELMITTPSIQSLIRDKKNFRITSEIQTGAKLGMKTFDTSLYELVKKGVVTTETALEKAFEPEALLTRIKAGER
jgi:twitching motility protein PilT